MKNRLIVCSLALIVTITTSLAIYLLYESQLNNYNSFECTEESNQNEELNQTDIEVSFAPDTVVSRESMVLRYTNNSDIPYHYDPLYNLQMLVLCEWEEVMPIPSTMNRLLIDHGILPNSHIDIEHRLQMSFEIPESGKFRIIREFTPITNNPDAQSIDVIFEFEL